MERPRCIAVSRSNQARLCVALLLSALLMLIVGCEGDRGPAGVQGPPGQSLDVIVAIEGSYPVLRADRSSGTDVVAKVSTLLGNSVEGIQVAFRILSGGGTLSRVWAETDAAGRAVSRYTAGSQAGTVVLSASVTRSGLVVTDTHNLYVDPLTVSTPLLTTEFADPLMAEWSHDGNTVFFQTSVYNEYGLYKVDAQGGTTAYIGGYRGGACNPDGSGRVAAFEPPTGNWPEDSKVFILDYDGQVLDGFRPSAFYGEVRAVNWCHGGDSLLIASNTNLLFCVSDDTGAQSRQFYGPISGGTISPVPNTPYVVVSGTGEYHVGIYRADLNTGEFVPLVSGGSPYTYGFNIFGAAVDRLGTMVAYSILRSAGDGSDAMQGDLRTIPFGGGLTEDLLTSPAQERYPAWSPDGTRVLFSSNRSGSGYNLYVYEVSP